MTPTALAGCHGPHHSLALHREDDDRELDYHPQAKKGKGDIHTAWLSGRFSAEDLEYIAAHMRKCQRKEKVA